MGREGVELTLGLAADDLVIFEFAMRGLGKVKPARGDTFAVSGGVFGDEARAGRALAR